jgi:hypothetical protein
MVFVATADAVVAIAGNARFVVDEGVAAARERVEDRGLADIRPADESDQWQHVDLSRLLVVFPALEARTARQGPGGGTSHRRVGRGWPPTLAGGGRDGYRCGYALSLPFEVSTTSVPVGDT